MNLIKIRMSRNCNFFSNQMIANSIQSREVKVAEHVIVMSQERTSFCPPRFGNSRMGRRKNKSVEDDDESICSKTGWVPRLHLNKTLEGHKQLNKTAS